MIKPTDLESSEMIRNQRNAIARFFAVVAIAFTFSTSSYAEVEAKRPNVVLILADDFGYECVAANGGKSYATPSLDALASSGVRFTHCFAQPLCTPTRVQLMTGIYNVRNYVDFGHLDPKATTFANLLKNSGYATGIAGKWQLGRDTNLPKTFGFEESCLWQLTRRPSRYKNPGLEINGKEVDFRQGEYGPDVVNDWAINFVERHRAEPFLLYYPLMLAHAPYEPTPESPKYADYEPQGDEEKKAGKGATENPRFGAMVTHLDRLVGKLVAKLDELKIRENTLILFVGDNGTGVGVRTQVESGFIDGAKGKLTSAGMHVPLIASWPGQIPAGRVNDDIVDTTDFLPTICEVTSIKPPANLPIDGHSFLPQLRGKKGTPREWYYSWYAPRKAFVGEFAANKQFKLYRSGKLFDVIADPLEQMPLAADKKSPEAKVAEKQLSAVLETHKNARPAHLITEK